MPAEFTMCGEFLNTLTCIYSYPACNASIQRLIPICEKQCPLIEVLAAQCLLIFLDTEFVMVKQLLDTFECKDLGTYYNFHREYFNTETNSTDCVMLSKYSYFS